ncbi:TetR/AcrR family transcriptional regulator [Arthrobacter sp.]|uniref:TetR/AcrR family transcriptional regulator n=1 Tax=Arthrobacter sp. TaxID=1667 RepID=UPI0026DF5F4E|nr:TetR/AcrR family transcriptional regulator [Arthrobacter sp.]MDO5752321.1 TetR/AcrR family transcriptional regulator [Arthrobacter sp.]
MQQRRRPAGRPPHPLLSSARITSAALKLIGRSGYRGLTMAALAKSLNVATSALYNHVNSKQDVLLLVEDHLMGRVDVSAFPNQPWETAVSMWAHSYRQVFASHLPLIPVIALLPVTDAPKTITMYEAVTQGFLAAGWPAERIIDAIVALESFIYGSAYDVNAPANIFDAGTRVAHSPNFSAAVARRGNLAGANNADAAFDMGLKALIQGLAAGVSADLGAATAGRH